MVAGSCKGGWDGGWVNCWGGGLIVDLWLQMMAGPSFREFLIACWAAAQNGPFWHYYL